MRYRLRTLMIVLALGPMVVAWGWSSYRDHAERERMVEIILESERRNPFYAGTAEGFRTPEQREAETRRSVWLWQKRSRESIAARP